MIVFAICILFELIDKLLFFFCSSLFIFILFSFFISKLSPTLLLTSSKRFFEYKFSIISPELLILLSCPDFFLFLFLISNPKFDNWFSFFILLLSSLILPKLFSSCSSSSLLSIPINIISSNPPKAIWLFLTCIVSLSPPLSSFFSAAISILSSSSFFSKKELIGWFCVLVLSSLSSFSSMFSSSFISKRSLLLPPKLISFILSTIISPPSSLGKLISLWKLNSMPFCSKLLKASVCPSIWFSSLFDISKLFFLLISSICSLLFFRGLSFSFFSSTPYMSFIILWGEILLFLSLFNSLLLFVSFNFVVVTFFPPILIDIFLK